MDNRTTTIEELTIEHNRRGMVHGRAWHFSLAFGLYSTIAILWLIAGLLPALAAQFPTLYASLSQLARTFVGWPWLSQLLRNVRVAALLSEPFHLVLYQYLFSLLNLGMAFALIRLRPRDWVARLFAIGMVGTAAIFNLQAHSAETVLGAVGEELHSWLHFVAGGAYALALVLFPHGSFPSLFSGRSLSRALTYLLQLLVGGLLVFIGGVFTYDGDPATYVLFYGIVAPLLGITAQALRYGSLTKPAERQLSQTFIGALALGLGLTLVIGVITWLLSFSYLRPLFTSRQAIEQITFFVFPLLYTIMPLALTLIVLRHRLWEIELLINRSLVYGTLTSLVVGLYVLIVGVVGLLAQSVGNLLLSVLATGLIAILFQPLRQRMQSVVNRLLYGERDDPVTVLEQLSRQLAQTTTPDAMLTTLVATVAHTLKLPYVALVTDDAATVIASQGSRTTLDDAGVEQWPLTHQGEIIGQLQIARRGRNESFPPPEQRLLQEIASRAGVALHAARLAGDLQQSRQQLVTAREEERRRLRRDLHDGLGPQLATLTLKIDAARNLLQRDPAQADRLLIEYKAQTQAALTDLRRIVHNLRPPALDQLGLLSALRQQITTTANGSGLHIELDAPEKLPTLPAAIEVAIYHIVLEALTNVIRHAQATRCTITLQMSDPPLYGGCDENQSLPSLSTQEPTFDFYPEQRIKLVICDDGNGLSSDYVAGVGLRSMRERAEELGGVFTMNVAADGGAQVTVQLPIEISFSTKEHTV